MRIKCQSKPYILHVVERVVIQGPTMCFTNRWHSSRNTFITITFHDVAHACHHLMVIMCGNGITKQNIENLAAFRQKAIHDSNIIAVFTSCAYMLFMALELPTASSDEGRGGAVGSCERKRTTTPNTSICINKKAMTLLCYYTCLLHDKTL